MSLYLFFVFLAQHTFELTISVIVLAVGFVLCRIAIVNTRNLPPSPLPFKLSNSSNFNSLISNVPNKQNNAAIANQNEIIPSQKQMKSSNDYLAPINENMKCIKKPPQIIAQNNIIKKRAKQQFKSSKVFWSNQVIHKSIKKTIPKPNENIKAKIAKRSPTSHIQKLQNELNLSCYPQYLDGYTKLSEMQYLFLSHIKSGNLAQIRNMTQSNNACQEIAQNINFGECQVLRECVLSEQLKILKYLKSVFVKEFDLNAENGYCLRWSSRKGLLNIVNYLLFEQKYQNINISYFQFQAIEWSIVYGHRQIAKLLQKQYKHWKLNAKWNVLEQSMENIGVDFDFCNLPSIYQEIIDIIIDHKNVEIIHKYYRNGCDLCFENNMPWQVSADCSNIEMLQFLHSTVNVSPVCGGNYLLRTALENSSLKLVQFAKRVINWQLWEQFVQCDMEQFKELCKGNSDLLRELEDYHSTYSNSVECTPPPSSAKNNHKNNQNNLPKTPIPWPYENTKEKYGILTRSKRKLLIKKGILEDPFGP